PYDPGRRRLFGPGAGRRRRRRLRAARGKPGGLVPGARHSLRGVRHLRRRPARRDRAARDRGLRGAGSRRPSSPSGSPATSRAALPGQLAAALAGIHALDVRAPGLAFLPRPPAGETPAAAELARHEQLYRAVTLDPHPALELALRWLAAAPPAPRAEALVHGD